MQCSDRMLKAFDSGCGGCRRTCECGITYFDEVNIWDWDEGELERLQQKAKDHPDKYIGCNCSLGTLRIGGVDIVYGCSCKLARQYEDFILGHTRQLAQYLNEYAVELKEKAEEIKVAPG